MDPVSGTNPSPAERLATLGGVGRLKPAPGTWGTALAAGVLWLLLPEGGLIAAMVALLLFVVAVPICAVAEHESRERDPGWIVLDEAVGMAVAVVALPHSPAPWLVAFLAFRAFDIAKPLGIDRAQGLPGGLGVVADDALAGLYANLLTHVLLIIFN